MSVAPAIQLILDTDFSATYDVDEDFTMSRPHYHRVFEIYFACTGGLNYLVNNTVYPVEKNDLFVFNYFDLHRICIPDEAHYERMIITFHPDYVLNLCTEKTDLLECFTGRGPNFRHRLPLPPAQASEYLELFREAQSHMQGDRFGEDVRKKMALVNILIFINRIYRDNIHSLPSVHDNRFARIVPILTYINENMNEKISLELLERVFYTDKYYLCKQFKKLTGFTVYEYIVRCRIMKAAELLRRDNPVSRVAEMTGFQNDSHFITTFKKLVGITPKQYAKGNVDQRHGLRPS